ncbi:hypothetical protein HL653_04115 [Sphingomonas sp. AP4-R1]|uniref:hypothetical protein n=1 Tax=Sphingomonas sp. AP4-R1 TaxID=2735134 RepID=UPI001493B6D8|nr:hypothetical protein [Sphingomonas sp. AP4-R1]QJU57081.1 hypothetical protein HL653_04115 [Sphingomonas sp. AP4-R1]
MNEPWFRAKRYGYGAGLPLTWQGWVTYLAFAAVMAGLWALPVHGRPIGLRAVMTAAAVAVLVGITRRHTEGGWRWRG